MSEAKPFGISKKEVWEAYRSTAKEWVARPARLLESGSSGLTYRLVIIMERRAVVERARMSAARKSDLPLSRFPLRGKAGAGGFPPRRWHAVRRQKALALIDAAAPPARGVSKR
jgi:hypothetical protein